MFGFSSSTEARAEVSEPAVGAATDSRSESRISLVPASESSDKRRYVVGSGDRVKGPACRLAAGLRSGDFVTAVLLLGTMTADTVITLVAAVEACAAVDDVAVLATVSGMADPAAELCDG